MSSKKTTVQNQSGTSATNTSTTPTVPDWFANPTQTAAGQVGALQSQGPAAFTPQISALQQQATTGAQNLTSSPYFDQAGSQINSVGNVDPSSVLTNLSNYYNPYQSQVTNPVLSDYDYQSGVTQAAQAANAAKTGAFGGSRYGIAQAQTASDLARGRAATEGTLLQNMYTQAAGMSEADAARAQQANLANQQTGLAKGTALAGLGASEGADTRANLGVQSELGGIDTNAQNAIKQYPIQYQQQIESLLSGLNPQLFTGQTGTGSGTTSSTSKTTESDQPGVLQAIGAATQLASLFSGLGAPMSAAAGINNLGGIGAQGSQMFSSGPFAAIGG